MVVEFRELVGREEELASLLAVLDARDGLPAVAVATGEAGIGKTTLWLAAVEAAQERGYLVLSCRPAEAEAAFSFVGLADLIGDVVPEVLPQLPRPQRRALEAALALSESDGAPADEGVVAFAFLNTLRRLAVGNPLLLAIDDVQWLDAPSLAMLRFALSRLETERVVAILSARDEVPLWLRRGVPEARLLTIELGPLSVGALNELLRTRVGAVFPRPTLLRIWETSAGNPFFALELARALQRPGGRVGPGEELPIPSNLEELVHERVDRLGAPGREVARVVAALADPTVRLVEAAAGRRAETGLGDAIEARILEVDGERLRFTHVWRAQRPRLRPGCRGRALTTAPRGCAWPIRLRLSTQPSLGTLRPAIEAAIPRPSLEWDRYERHRSATTERRAVEALARASRADEKHVNLHYRTDENGGIKRFELDGVVCVDSALFVVEAKASAMRPAARRGAPRALHDWLRRELARAANQLARTRAALLEDRVPIEDQNGKRVDVQLEEVRHVIHLVVVLEDMPALAPRTWELADAGVLPSTRTPIVISLHELEVICDIVERPSELIHYFLRRQRMNEQRAAVAVDELDYFMHYLRFGLFWPDRDEEADGPRVAEELLSHTDDLDAYYMFVRGERKTPAPRPGKRHNRAVAALLDCLDEQKGPGHLDAALGLLELDVSARERVAGDLRRLRNQSARDGRTHDRTYFGDDFGVTIMSVPPRRAAALAETLEGYCTLKKHQLRVPRWLGLGVFAGPPEPQVTGVFNWPWEPDPGLDRLLEDLPSAGHEHESFDGRKLHRDRPSRARGSSATQLPAGNGVLG